MKNIRSGKNLAVNLISSLNKKIVTSKRKIIDYGVSKKGTRYPIYEPLGEVNTEPSLTVPDMSLPLKTLITRYRRDGTEFLEGVYTGDDPDLPDNFEHMDKMQRIDFARENAARIAQGRASLDKRNKSSTEAEFKAKFDAAVSAEIEKIKAVIPPDKSKKSEDLSTQ